MSAYLARLEDLSYILMWTKTNVTGPKTPVTVDVIEMPRQQLSFYSKNVSGEGEPPSTQVILDTM